MSSKNNSIIVITVIIWFLSGYLFVCFIYYLVNLKFMRWWVFCAWKQSICLINVGIEPQNFFYNLNFWSPSITQSTKVRIWKLSGLCFYQMIPKLLGRSGYPESRCKLDSWSADRWIPRSLIIMMMLPTLQSVLTDHSSDSHVNLVVDRMA